MPVSVSSVKKCLVSRSAWGLRMCHCSLPPCATGRAGWLPAILCAGMRQLPNFFLKETNENQTAPTCCVLHA